MEEYSISSSIHKSVASKGTITNKTKDSAEESGWTAYFEDFSHNDHDHCSSFNCSSSLISDAATTGAAWKISHINHHVFASSSTYVAPQKIPKKTRTKEICKDDSLEDTASSPVNSPRGKETASENYSEIQIEEESKMDFDHEKNDCIDQLKKRGLCSVPLSMLVN
ncbi:uncharacterized protein LOC111289046 [Durio zibethinus]|uniref:Uncharacterized protein LOC111289046 n=1 Tax=Durio zibethinus TaxID=66656 RepID=A0A6P5Y5D8_DURZI|nr:uncharacterized protein LOC111289046 [Durio zibethinus]